jgi:hypothetical protein
MRSLLALFVVLAAASAAQARPQFFEKFKELYAGPEAPKGFPEKVADTKCNVCHIPEKNKKMKNSYGEALQKAGFNQNMAKGIAGGDANAIKKANDGFKKVEAQKSPDGPTYGELFKAGKLHSK